MVSQTTSSTSADVKIREATGETRATAEPGACSGAREPVFTVIRVLRRAPAERERSPGIPLVVGLALIVAHEVSGVNHGPASEPSSVVAPATTGERVFWVFMSFTAGVCEELGYRGFGIRVLQGRNMRTWQAVALATLAFVLMHGISVLRLPAFLIIFTAGLLFSVLFLWYRSLALGICLHTLFDLAAIGFP